MYEINYLSIPKRQRYNRWRLGMDKQFHPTLYWACDHLSMVWLKVIYFSAPEILYLK